MWKTYSLNCRILYQYHFYEIQNINTRMISGQGIALNKYSNFLHSKYKHNYEKERGKMVGFRSLEDDPKLVHSMQVAKMQSDREYKKNYEKTKTSYHTLLTCSVSRPPRMPKPISPIPTTSTWFTSIFSLPDAMNIQLSKNMNRLQSDVSDLSGVMMAFLAWEGDYRLLCHILVSELRESMCFLCL